jgi:hypothetical protein
MLLAFGKLALDLKLQMRDHSLSILIIKRITRVKLWKNLGEYMFSINEIEKSIKGLSR